LDPVSRIYWLLEDCKRYGTLPFAGLARAGFIAVQMLRSLVNLGVLTEEDYQNYMGTIDSVSSKMSADLSALPQEEFLSKYGHLRPGTYDILSPRYDEAPHFYFDKFGKNENVAKCQTSKFSLSLDQLRQTDRLLKEHRLDLDVLGLFDFIKGAIEGREYSKFVFSRSISDSLSLIKQWGAEHGFTADDCSYFDIASLRGMYAASGDCKKILGDEVAKGKKQHAITRNVILPPLIASQEEVWSFEVPASVPNFVSLKSATGHTSTIDDDRKKFEGSILLIPSADPGYDWIFSTKIAGFVTKFGGANSHMAIRAAELGVPAIIGSGESLFSKCAAARKLSLDCANKQVSVLL
jgi:phosphohistidine swiveling domain-containing protein